LALPAKPLKSVRAIGKNFQRKKRARGVKW